MKGLSAKFHITIGLGFLLVSLLLSAIFLGLVPDRHGAIREGRANLAEAVAASSSLFIEQGDIQSLEASLEFIVKRNPDILSAAVRPVNGAPIVTIGDHGSDWSNAEDGHSTEDQLRVPIWAGDGKWGDVELRVQPLTSPGWVGLVQNPQLQLVLFVAGAGFIIFYFYLGKMLRHLDPSQAVPTRVRAALDTMVEGLLVVDGAGHIVLANLAFAEVIGKPPDDLLGAQACDFAWSTAEEASPADGSYPWNRALSEGTPQRNDMIYLTDSESKRRSFIVNCSPILGSGGKQGGVLISFDDVTLLEEKEIELRLSKEAAESANKAKSDFLANMSHEIRSPMNAILGFTDILKRGYHKDEADWKKYLNTIHASGSHLLELINDVLDLSKVESGNLDIEQIQCPAHDIVREVVQVLNVKAQEKGIALDFEIAGAIPETVISDPARLRQIVTNLVGNAIKFTEQGRVSVVVRLNASDKEPLLAIDVIDSGIGMSESQLDSIFDEFVQADTSITRRFGGTGLGLSISRKLAHALGGDITVNSEQGKGSVFTATIATGPLADIRLLEGQELLAAQEETRAGFRYSLGIPACTRAGGR